MLLTEIHENYARVRSQIEAAARIAGRNPDDIHLVVVTKTHPFEIIQEVVNAGAIELGENYVEEAIPKIRYFSSVGGIRWHMIGHVQSRKALVVCEYFDYIHSLDSVKLAERLSRFAVEQNRKIPIFLEINLSGEETKSGWKIESDEGWEKIMPDIEKILDLHGIKLIGLMTIPPYSSDPETTRPYYRKLREFQENLIGRFNLKDCTELSMGMSGDFEVAIQEGATWVRIGHAILGPRGK